MRSSCVCVCVCVCVLDMGDGRCTCACGDVNPEVERCVVPVQDLIIYDRQLICVNTKTQHLPTRI